ncbi:MAG TPA: class I SAM-dependent methyltransferase [Anaerohalosphaeraceae bacterium]|nr:class I SAM-dependent methyltransferase [Anaerohalosphaeraceae bacterium]
MIYYWPERKRLIFLQQEASPDFWDKWWENEDWYKRITSCRNSRYWHSIVNKYIPDKNGRILEGGCGDGRLVDAMKYWGYEAVGIDYATATVKKINEVMPDLDVRYGDVRKLEFEDNSFDGYWSLGVIEHFWEGYEDIISEMKRVLKPGGYLFLYFPSVSLLDRMLVPLNKYKIFHGTEKPELFYQFGLDVKSVKKELLHIGFECVDCHKENGLLGIERVFPSFKKYNQKMMNMSQRNKIFKLSYYAASMILSPLCGHNAMMVFRKPY